MPSVTPVFVHIVSVLSVDALACWIHLVVCQVSDWMWILRDRYCIGSNLVKKRDALFLGHFFAYKKYFLFEFTNKSCIEYNFVTSVYRFEQNIMYPFKKTKHTTTTTTLPKCKKNQLCFCLCWKFADHKVTFQLVTFESICFNSNLTFFKTVGHVELLCKYYHLIPVAPADIVVLSITGDKATQWCSVFFLQIKVIVISEVTADLVW